MDEAIRRGVEAEGAPEFDGGLDPVRDEGVVGRPVAVGQHADRDQGAIAVERIAERPPARVTDRDTVAAIRVHVADVGAIDPRMAAVNALFAARRKYNSRSHDRFVLRSAFYVLVLRASESRERRTENTER